MADCAAIKSKLDAASAAYDRLVNMQAPRVVVDSDGSRVEYTAVSAPALYAVVQRLQAQYDACVNSTPAVITRPLNFLF